MRVGKDFGVGRRFLALVAAVCTLGSLAVTPLANAATNDTSTGTANGGDASSQTVTTPSKDTNTQTGSQPADGAEQGDSQAVEQCVAISTKKSDGSNNTDDFSWNSAGTWVTSFHPVKGKDVCYDVTFADNVRAIGGVAHNTPSSYNDYRIGTLTIGKDVTLIGVGAFGKGNIQHLVFADDAQRTETLRLSTSSFAESGLTGTLTLPAKYQGAGDAFRGTYLEQIIFPDNSEAKQIAGNEFSLISTLKYVKLPPQLTSVSANAFSRYNGSEPLTIVWPTQSDTLIIGGNAFVGQLQDTIIFPDNLKKIVFQKQFGNAYNSGLKSVVFPKMMEDLTFGQVAFQDRCTDTLTNVTLPEQVTNLTISDNAFQQGEHLRGCKSESRTYPLQPITLPATVSGQATIGNAFYTWFMGYNPDSRVNVGFVIPESSVKDVKDYLSKFTFTRNVALTPVSYNGQVLDVTKYVQDAADLTFDRNLPEGYPNQSQWTRWVNVPLTRSQNDDGSYTWKGTAPSSAPTLTGYTFKVWKLVEDNGTSTEGTDVQPGKEFTVTAGKWRMVAQWEPEAYKITYANLPEGAQLSQDAPLPYAYTYDKGFDLPSMTWPGHKFLGWTWTSSLTEGDVNFDSGNTPVTGKVDPFKVAGDLALTPQFADTAAVTYDKNNEKATGTTAPTLNVIGTKVKLSANGFQLAGYHFVGWNTQADGKGKSYQPGEEFSLTGDATLYAQWQKDSTGGNGGSGNGGNNGGSGNNNGGNGGTTTPSATIVDVERFYNPRSGEHFYTAGAVEQSVLRASGVWRDEGVAFRMSSDKGTPVYRLYNPGAKHLFTTSQRERDVLVKAGWRFEGIAFYVPDGAKTDVHRLYNPGNGDHLLTTSANERGVLVMHKWRDEGIAFKAQ